MEEEEEEEEEERECKLEEERGMEVHEKRIHLEKHKTF